MNIAKIVIDLGFGDGGKGLVVDNLCQNTINNYESPLVVRFSGGQQAGHTVMTEEGVKHTFSSFGAGTLAGCSTFFTEDTTVYLPNLLNEYAVLRTKYDGPIDLMIHPLAKLTTPFDVAYNRAKEELVSRHGSCGLGVGATMKRCLETPYKTFVQDLQYKNLLHERMWSVHLYYKNLIGDNIELEKLYTRYVQTEFNSFGDTLEHFDVNKIFKITSTPYDMYGNRDVIFEGSQGVMLDMDHGVFPNVTYSNTTCKNAMKYVEKWKLFPFFHYVTRCYTTRHGVGWMPDERKMKLINTEEEINVTNPWQQDFRLGEFDYDMINNSIAIDGLYHGDFKCEKSLVLTCLDQRPDFQFEKERIRGVDRFFMNDSPRRNRMI